MNSGIVDGQYLREGAGCYRKRALVVEYLAVLESRFILRHFINELIYAVEFH